MEASDLRKLSKTRFEGTLEEFEKVKHDYDNYDIVYNMRRNVGGSYHEITVYKKPDNIDDWETAFAIDGYFFSVYRCGPTLQCWYD